MVGECDLVDADSLQLKSPAMPVNGLHGPDGLDDVRILAEREVVLATLRESGFNISECARRLRVSRVTVYRLCRKHHLELDSMRG